MRCAGAIAALGVALIPASAQAASASLNGPPSGATFTSPASITFAATRDESGCNIAPSAATFGLYLNFPGASSFDIFQYNISDEATISRTQPLSQPGTYQWKTSFPCVFDPTTGNTSIVVSETRTFTLLPAGSAPPIKPSNSSPPVISGTTTAGQTLTSSTGAWSGSPPISYSYQWARCTSLCSPIGGATSSSYTLTGADAGARIAVVVSAINSAGNGQVTSSQVGPVVAAGPTSSQVKAALLKALAVSGQAAKIAQLLKHGGLVIAFTAPSAGHLVISWYMVPKGAHLTKSKQPVLVATGSVTFHGAGKAKVKIALTGKAASCSRTPST